MKDSNILVTGGAGFIGSHLVDALIGKGANVTVLDIEKKDRLPKNITFVKGDVADPSSWNFKKIDFVFHLAAMASPGECEKNPQSAFSTNVYGTFNALQFCQKEKIKKFIFPSSAQLYGRDPKLPMDETLPIHPSQNAYCMTKSIGENLCNFFQEHYDLPLIFFRLFNVFGPSQDNHYFIPTLITQGISEDKIEIWTKKPTRDFIYVKDVVKALIAAAESDYTGGPINIGSGTETKTGDLADKIASRLNVKVNSLNKDVIGCMRMLCDNSKAKEILGWTPETDFNKGIEETIDWYKEHHVKK